MSLIQRTGILVLAPALLLSLPHRALAQNTPATGAAYSELTDGEGSFVRTIQTNLIAEKFDDLDQLASQLRRDKSRFPGGEWKLRIFYSALDAPQQTDKDSMDHIAHLERWMKLRPESITARVALATSLHRWAWVARGNGFARTVTPEGWQLFHERMQRAQDILEGSRNLPMCPQWYSEMMTVGLAENWDAARMQETLDRGIQFEPGYFYLYKQYANYLLPKWDGHPGDASAFAKSSADRLGGDSGDILYFQIATELIRQGDGDFPVAQMDWTRIQHGYQALTTQYGGDKITRNQLAFMAWRYRDADTASRQFALIGDDWSRNVWRDRIYFDRARDWSHRVNTAGQ